MQWQPINATFLSVLHLTLPTGLDSYRQLVSREKRISFGAIMSESFLAAVNIKDAVIDGSYQMFDSYADIASAERI